MNKFYILNNSINSVFYDIMRGINEQEALDEAKKQQND